MSECVHGDEAKNLYPDNSVYQEGVSWFNSFESSFSQFVDYYECKKNVCSPSAYETCLIGEITDSKPTWWRAISASKCQSPENFNDMTVNWMECAREKTKFLKCVDLMSGALGPGFPSVESP